MVVGSKVSGSVTASNWQKYFKLSTCIFRIYIKYRAERYTCVNNFIIVVIP